MLAVRGSFARRNKLHIKRKQGSTLLKRFCNLPSFRWPRFRGCPDLSSVIVLPIRCSLTCCVIFTAKCPAAADAPVLPMARGNRCTAATHPAFLVFPRNAGCASSCTSVREKRKREKEEKKKEEEPRRNKENQKKRKERGRRKKGPSRKLSTNIQTLFKTCRRPCSSPCASTKPSPSKLL